MRRCTHQRARLGAERVGGVEELEAGLGVVGDLLPVLEPLVLGLGEALLLHAAQLRRLAERHRFWDAALWHHGLHCSDKQQSIQLIGRCDIDTGLFDTHSPGDRLGILYK